jgi:hypothetical protein
MIFSWNRVSAMILVIATTRLPLHDFIGKQSSGFGSGV